MGLDNTAIITLRNLGTAGTFKQLPDSGMGPLTRPFARPDGGPVSTLETLFDFFIDDVPDPDEALKLNPKIREQLRMHPDVVSAMRKRELTVAGFPDRIDPNPAASNQDAAKFIAGEVEKVWRNLPNLHHLYQQMESAVMDGGIGLEFIWRREGQVEFPFRWQAIHKSRIVYDRLGNMAIRTRYQPVWGAYVAANAENINEPPLIFPQGKFIYHMHRMEPGTWDQPELEGYRYFGVGEDVSLYYVITFDVFVLKFRMKWLEKFGMPPTDVYYPDSMPQYQSNLKSIAAQVRGESVCTIPRMAGKEINSLFEVKTREVPKMSYDAFESFSERYTKPRVDSILLGSAEEGQKTDGKGGYSDHVSRRDSGPQVWFKWDATNISSTLNAQLIPAITRGRFPNIPQDLIPIHRIEPKEERDRLQELQLIEGGSKLVPLAESEVYERLGYRKPNVDEKTISGGGLGEGNPFETMPPQMKPMVGAPRQKTPIGQANPQQGKTIPRGPGGIG